MQRPFIKNLFKASWSIQRFRLGLHQPLVYVWMICLGLTTGLQAQQWQLLSTEAYPGKQDDIWFVDEQFGWYINGDGKLFATEDGGQTWTLRYRQKGTFFRCLAFIDRNHGFIGNVGTDYFPGVKDTIPLYETKDGGYTWAPVTYKGPYVKGLCAITLVREPYIQHGVLGEKVYLYGVGRVGGPGNLMVSLDGGASWESRPVPEAGMMFDIHMFNAKEGVVCSSNHADVTQAKGQMLATKDGGQTWEVTYLSERNMETVWKVHFPTPHIGYGAVQSYDPANTKQRYIKTTDGGKTWKEFVFLEEAAARPFGIGFLNEKRGFIGTATGGHETKDGGKTWKPVMIGRAANKIRFYKDKKGKDYGFSIGVQVYSWR